jgi:hypothetical protein
MDEMPGRYNQYRYSYLCERKLNEFGTYSLHGAMLFKKNDVFVFAYGGIRIVDIYPDDTCYLIIPDEVSLSSGVTQSWSRLSPRTMFEYRRNKRASGLVEYDIYRYVRSLDNNRLNLTGKVDATSKVRYNLDGSLSIEDIPQKYAVQNRVKYHTFNKQLKNLRAVLYAQIKMHAHSQDVKDWRVRSAMRTELHAKLATTHFGTQDGAELAYNLVDDWMHTQDPQTAKFITMLAFTFCSSKADGMEAMLRQVGNLLRLAQSHYLREHCVTIVEGIPGSAHDQKSEFQPPDGLREMQLFGEAQVHRQDPGTAT